MKIKCCKNKKVGSELKGIVDFLKVISEENRLRILCILKEQEMCVCEIWQYLDSPQNLTSHHLKVLKGFSLISSRKDGLKVFYKLNKIIIKKYLKLLNKFL
ncbi:metalloregulator ArsR/SmtB family transcription factor [Patescibacteria group bacterium]|nr:metalloregulator ArsR/SmtB family transcription factor [Patescibacteria group bacterium]